MINKLCFKITLRNIREKRKLRSILKEIREYIEENRDRKTGRLDSRLKKVLEILDRLENK